MKYGRSGPGFSVSVPSVIAKVTLYLRPPPLGRCCPKNLAPRWFFRDTRPGRALRAGHPRHPARRSNTWSSTPRAGLPGGVRTWPPWSCWDGPAVRWPATGCTASPWACTTARSTARRTARRHTRPTALCPSRPGNRMCWCSDTGRSGPFHRDQRSPSTPNTGRAWWRGPPPEQSGTACRARTERTASATGCPTWGWCCGPTISIRRTRPTDSGIGSWPRCSTPAASPWAAPRRRSTRLCCPCPAQCHEQLITNGHVFQDTLAPLPNQSTFSLFVLYYTFKL